MIEWQCDGRWLINGADDFSTSLGHRVSLSPMAFAIEHNKMELFDFLLQLSVELNSQLLKDGESIPFKVDIAHFNAAIRMGRTAILAELIKATGAGIPFDELVEKSGVVLEEKPKYYQGLNVGGMKRTVSFTDRFGDYADHCPQDWAQAGRGRYSVKAVTNEKQTPLLQAAHYGNIDSVQWFLSDAPARRYQEFAEANKSDRRVQALEQSKDGLEKTISNWLNSNS